MKRLLLLFLIGLIYHPAFTQDLEIYGSWALVQLEVKWANPYMISEVEPPISPWLTIHENLDFEGFGSCNTFSGNFINFTTNHIEPINFVATTLECETQFIGALEDEYFHYFNSETSIYYNVYFGNDGMKYLRFESGIYAYHNIILVESALATEDEKKALFVVYPNPVSDLLFISSETTTVENISVYNLSGQNVLEQID